MAATKIILKKDIYNIIHLNIGANSNDDKKKIALNYVCSRLQIDKNNTSVDIQEAVNAIKICLQTKFFNK